MAYLTPRQRRELSKKGTNTATATTEYLTPRQRRMAEKQQQMKFYTDNAEGLQAAKQQMLDEKNAQIEQPKNKFSPEFKGDTPLLQGLRNNPVSKLWDNKIAPVLDVAGQGMKEAVFGDKSITPGRAETTGNKTVDTIAKTAGGLGALALPVGGVSSVVGGIRSGAEMLAGKVTPFVSELPVVSKLAKSAATGLIESVPYTAQQIAVNKDLQNSNEAIKTAALSATLGAGGELLGVGLGALLKKIKAKVPLSAVEIDEIKKSPEMMDIPEVKQYLADDESVKKAVTVDTGNPLLNSIREQVGLNEPGQAMMDLMRRSTQPTKTANNIISETLDTLPKTQATNGAQSVEGALPKPSNSVVMESKKIKPTFKDALSKFYTKTVDTQRPIEKLSKVAGDETFMKASNSRNAGGTTVNIIENALTDRQGNKIGISLKELAKKIPEGKEKDFWDYMSMRHNIDRAREGKNVIANYDSVMSQQATEALEKANPNYKVIGDDIVKWIDDFMQEWGVKAGTVKEDLYKGLRETYKSYFPTQREFSQLEDAISDGVSRRFVDQSSPVKKATGSARDINNPIENIMNLVDRTVKTARYNEVGQSLLDSVRKQPEKLKQFAEVVAEKGNTDNIVTVLDGGNPVYLKINNKELLDALNGLPKVVNNLRVMRAISNGFKQLITQKNPLFAFRNIFRDIPTAYIYGNEKNPFKFVGNLAKASKEILTNGEGFQKYKAMGAGQSQFFSTGTVEETAKNLTKGKKNNIFLHPLKAIEKFNSLTETAPRLAEFNSILEKTGDVNKALYAANNVTVNFARGGDVTKTAEAFIPYINAGVQGLDRFFRSFKDPKTAIATIAKGGAAITIPEVALYLVNKDDPNYQELDNRTKDTYYLIPDGNGKFIKIPKSRELGVLFGALFNRAMRAANGEKDSFKGFTSTVANNFTPGANPFTDNIFAPAMYNIPVNKDFANRTIVPTSMKMDGRSNYLQYDEKTSEIAKAIGKFAADATGGEGLSPKQIDYLIRSYTGIIGQVGLPLATKGGEAGKAITNSFVADPLYSNKTFGDFYDNYDRLQRTASDKNILEKIPSKALTAEEKAKNNFTKANKLISELTKLSSRVQAGTDSEADSRIFNRYKIDKMQSKQEVLKQLKAKQLEIAKAANQSITGGQK